MDGTITRSDDSFAENLRYLCSKQKSVSDVCRRLGINRPQFGRYLHGKGKPNAHNLMLISEFFGVTTSALRLPHDEFLEHLSAPVAPPRPKSARQFSLANSFANPPDEIRRYEGFYHVYHSARTLNNAIITSLYRLEMQGVEMHCKAVYRGVHPILGGRFLLKHTGQVFYDQRQLYITKGILPKMMPLSFDIVNVSSFGVVKYFKGGLMGHRFGTQSIRMKRTVWTFLGKDCNLRDALGSCGVFRENSTRIDPNIRRILAEESNST